MFTRGRAPRLLALAALLVLAMPDGPRAADYCIDAVAGNDGNTGLCPTQAWATLGPSQSHPFVAGDIVRIAAGRYVHPLTGWYMKPGVSWAGAGADLTTVVFDKAVQ